MENYIREGLAPLKRYLSISQQQQQDQEQDGIDQDSPTRRRMSKGNGKMMDWGIDLEDMDNINDISSPTLINDFTINTSSTTNATSDNGEDIMDGLTPFVEDKFHDWGISPKKSHHDNHHRFTLRDFVMDLFDKLNDQKYQNMKFLDEFRYILVSSQLLDETILISKFKKKSLMDLNQKGFQKFGHLIKINSNFQINSIISTINILKIINVLSYLQKNQFKYSLQQIRLVLMISTIHLSFIVNSKLLKLKIIQTKILNQLRKFIKNFQKFDTLIQKLITKFKELKIYNNIPSLKSQTTGNNENPDSIYDLTSSSLILSINSITNSFKSLLSLTNGIELENYCGIYNIELTRLGFQIDELKSLKLIDDNQDDVDLIVSKFKKLQFLRRFLIVVLLTINQFNNHSPFSNKVFEIFKIKQNGGDCKVSFLSKLIMVSNNLNDISQFCETLNQSIKQSIDVSNTIINHSEFHQNDSSSSIDLLLNKIKEFELQLIIARSSKNPTHLKELGSILENLSNLYKKECSTSQTNSNLLKIAKQRKRFSLPSTALPIQQQQQRSKSTSSKRNSYKRLSTGFTLPLLTVTENEEEDEEVKTKRAVSYDDNYLNIMPSHETFTIDNYINDRNLLSNDDSVVITYGDGGDKGDDEGEETFDNEEFKKKLELNFTRMIQGDSKLKYENNEEVNDEVNFNDQQIDKEESAPLMNELRNVLNR